MSFKNGISIQVELGLQDLEMVPVVDDVTSETGVFQGLSVVATNKLNPSIQLKLTIKMLRGHPLA